jgi:outer membrane lipoprotein-sorting protein
VTALVASAFLLGSCQSGPTAEEIVAKMREVEASIQDAHAVVAFDLHLEDLDALVVVEMWERAPNQFRAQVVEDDSGQFAGLTSVTDGEQVWLYHPGENEVVAGRVGEFGFEEPLSPHLIMEQMREVIDYVLDHSEVELDGEEEVAGSPAYRLVLEPRPDDDARLPLPLMGTTTLWVEKERWVLLKARLTGSPVGEGTMTVRSFVFNEGVASDRFRLQPPPGVTVRTVESLEPRRLTLDEALLDAPFGLLLPSFVPAGTTLIDVFETNGRYVLRYDHGETAFTIVQQKAVAEQALPSVEGRPVTVRGVSGSLIVSGEGDAILTWIEDGVSVTIGGRISEDDIMRVADSLS